MTQRIRNFTNLQCFGNKSPMKLFKNWQYTVIFSESMPFYAFVLNFWHKKLFHKLMIYFNNQFCSSLRSSDNLNGEMSRSDVDDTYGDLGGSGTGVHGVCTEIYRGWGHQRLTSSSVWQLLIGSIYKKKKVDPSNTIFFFYKLLLIKGCIAFS